jgi:RHH-type rel operon transcriptional repressor/antitoxin RelB
MTASTFTVRVDPAVKKRLERLAKSTGRSRSSLAAEAIDAYLDDDQWQRARIKDAMTSLDRGEGVSHDRVKEWVASWDTNHKIVIASEAKQSRSRVTAARDATPGLLRRCAPRNDGVS